MNAELLLDELAGLGIHLVRDGGAILADVEGGADAGFLRADRITTHKPALLRSLLQREIVAAAAAEPGTFDRPAYDELWRRWRALARNEETPS